MLGDYLEQAADSMPEQLILEQATECFTYSIAASMANNPNGRIQLLQGLLQIYALQENTEADACKMRRPLHYIEQILIGQ